MANGGREVYFEHRVVGRHAKVTAICSVTGIEVSVVGPATAHASDMETIALRRLEARIAADQEGGTPRTAPSSTPGTLPAGRGRIV